MKIMVSIYILIKVRLRLQLNFISYFSIISHVYYNIFQFIVSSRYAHETINKVSFQEFLFYLIC